MTVSQLIKKLEKMPQGAMVGASAHDNSEWEVAGWINSVICCNKSDFIDGIKACGDKDAQRMFEDNPNVWVILGC